MRKDANVLVAGEAVADTAGAGVLDWNAVGAAMPLDSEGLPIWNGLLVDDGGSVGFAAENTKGVGADDGTPNPVKPANFGVGAGGCIAGENDRAEAGPSYGHTSGVTEADGVNGKDGVGADMPARRGRPFILDIRTL